MKGFAGTSAVADAVMFEGYMLYPYRANDAKNRVRWQFGVLAPPAYAAADPSERSFLQTDCLLEGHDAQLSVRVRFLQVQRRTVEAVVPGGYAPVDTLDVGDACYLPWEEATVQEPTVQVALPGIEAHANTHRIQVDGGTSVEALRDGERAAGRLVRTRKPLAAELSVSAEPLPGPYGMRRLRLRLENRSTLTPPDPGPADRAEALRYALVAAHLLIGVEHGAFVSLLDPPEWAKEYVGQCEQLGAYPVLGGAPGERGIVLATPIILYDHPAVAPESALQFCDATEVDELLALRTLTLTEQEKRQARGSDPRAAELIDQVDTLSPELMDRLHGAIRSMTSLPRPAPPPPEPAPWWDPAVDAGFDPATDVVLVAGLPVGRGATVRLRPGRRRADAQDMFLDGRTATVEAVLSDVEGGSHLAVSLDELAEDGLNPHGRFLYFAPDEVEPVAPRGV